MKRLILIFLLSSTITLVQKRPYYVLDSANIGKSSKIGLSGTLVLRKIDKSGRMIIHLVNGNVTYKVIVRQKSLFTAFNEPRVYVLTNLIEEK